MRQHIFCFTVFIVIFGLMSIGTVDAATTTEYFDSDPGWTSFNTSVNNNDFGFRDSDFAGGNTGEAGGFFSRSNQVAWYGNDSIGNFTGEDSLSASGLMNIYDVDENYNNNIHIGHFDNSGPSHINGIGFLILEYPVNNQTINPSSFRIFYEIGDTQGDLFIITGINESRTWSYSYDPDDGNYGSLTVSISGTGGNTEKVFLSESQRNSIGNLNTFGLAVEGLDSAPEQLEFYIDNVSYTSDEFNEPPALEERVQDLESQVEILLDQYESLQQRVTGLEQALDALADHSHTYMTGKGKGHNNTPADTGPPIPVDGQ